MTKQILRMIVALVAGSMPLMAQPAQSVETLVSTGLIEPFGVAADVVTNALYITDSVNNRVVRFSEAGTLTTLAGMEGTVGDADGSGLRARFFSPQGIVVSDGKLFVADSGNHRIRAVTFDGVVTTVAGSTAGKADGQGLTAQFNAPAGMAVDADGNIFIADVLNNAIRKLTPGGSVTTVVATNLYRPSAVALANDGRLFIADSGDNCIKLWQNNSLTVLAGRDSRSEFGNVDAVFASDARFNNPRGLLWRGDENGLLVSDSGNGLIRRIFYNTNMTCYSVETYAVLGNPGISHPVGLAQDQTESVVVADLGQNSILRLPSSLVTLPAVNPPRLGIIILSTNWLSGIVYADLLDVTNSTFNNDNVVAVVHETGTEVFYSYGDTRNPRAVPDPTRDSLSPPPFTPGPIGYIGDPIELLLPLTLVRPITPDVTVKAIGVAPGRKPSPVVVGQFRYQVANPSIDGINMAGFTITNSTFGAELYYTIDGSEPTTNSTHYLGGRISIFNGLTNDVVFKVRGFKEGYHPSSVVMQTFLFKNLKTSSIGINQTFEAAPGSTIVVPVGMNLLSGDRLRSLQFRTEIKPETAAAPVLPTNNFRAMVVTSNDFIQLQVPAVSGKTAVAQTKSYLNGYTTGVAVAYVATNSFFELTETGPVILLAVQIPASAQAGQVYSLSVLEPSGTLDGFQSTVVLSSLAPTTIKVSTDLGYLVGDVSGYPGVTWYNAGRFGNTNLNNSDVNVAFYASMGLRLPYSFSDIFDAMDAYPMDTPSSVGGDGQIRYLDWQVTLDRSLRLNTNNWWRQLTENGRQPIRTQLSNSPDSPAESYDNSGLAWFRQARIVAGVVENAQPGQRVSVPIYLEVQPGFQVAGLQFRTLITPMNGGPEIAQQGDFAPAGGIPTPPWKLNAAANDILQGWALGNFSPALQNKMLLGHIRFVIPSGAVSGQSYAVQFTGVDGAPNLDTQYDLESIPGCAWVECSAQQPAETMSDEWKRRFFGSLTHPLAQAGADPDDDGVENAREYAGGTNPVSLRIHTGQLLSPTTTPQGVVLRWFGELGKFYLIESSASLQDGDWQSIAGNLQGQGEVIEYVVKTVAGNNRFYRVRTQ